MKKIYRIFILIAIASIVTIGCEKVKDLNTVSFEPTFSTDLECNVPASGKAPLLKTFTSSGTIDPQDDEDVKKYLNKIRTFEVTSLTGTITSISPNNATLIAGSIVVSTSTSSTQWSVENVPLTVGQKITLGNKAGEWDKVNQILKDGQKFTVTASGETDKAGILFTIKIEIKSKAEAKAI